VILGVNNRIKKKKFKIELLKAKADDIFVLYYKDCKPDEIMDTIRIIEEGTGRRTIALPRDMELRARSAALYSFYC